MWGNSNNVRLAIEGFAPFSLPATNHKETFWRVNLVEIIYWALFLFLLARFDDDPWKISQEATTRTLCLVVQQFSVCRQLQNKFDFHSLALNFPRAWKVRNEIFFFFSLSLLSFCELRMKQNLKLDVEI